MHVERSVQQLARGLSLLRGHNEVPNKETKETPPHSSNEAITLPSEKLVESDVEVKEFENQSQEKEEPQSEAVNDCVEKEGIGDAADDICNDDGDGDDDDDDEFDLT